MAQEPETAEDHLLKALNAACAEERIVTMPGPMQLSAAFPEAKPPFKSIKMKGNEDLLLKGCRLGRRDPFIVMLAPMDTVDYAHVEVVSSKLSQFGALESHFVDSLAGYLHARQAEAGLEDLNAPFISSNDSPTRAVSTFLSGMLPILDALKAARIAAAEKEAAAAYADSDAWGTW